MRTLPVLHLTFDDAPSDEFTTTLLELLARHDVTATFFAVGRQVRRFPELAARIAEQGHGVECHSDSHADLSTLTYTEVRSDLEAAAASISGATGRRPVWFRAPFGHLDGAVRRAVTDCGLREVPTTHQAPDSSSSTTIDDLVALLDSVTDGSIVGMHEWGMCTGDALERWLAASRERFVFSALPTVQPRRR